MLVRFVTNNKVTSRGFQANYFTVLLKTYCSQVSELIIVFHNFTGSTMFQSDLFFVRPHHFFRLSIYLR